MIAASSFPIHPRAGRTTVLSALTLQRILPIDLSVAVVAGEMLDAARSHAPGYSDIAIAATAKVHDMTVLTRNERYFVPLAVKVIDPFTHLP